MEGQKKKNLTFIFFKCSKNNFFPPFKSWRKYLDKEDSFPKREILNLGVKRNISAKQKQAKRDTSEKNKKQKQMNNLLSRKQ